MVPNMAVYSYVHPMSVLTCYYTAGEHQWSCVIWHCSFNLPIWESTCDWHCICSSFLGRHWHTHKWIHLLLVIQTYFKCLTTGEVWEGLFPGLTSFVPWHDDVAVLFRLTSDSAVLSSINSLVGVAFSDVDNFSATEAFIATWENVVPYTEGTISVSDAGINNTLV